MKKSLQRFLWVLLLISAHAYSQTRTVTGTVTGSDNGFPLPGVSVSVRGSSAGTQTDPNGKFSISATNGTTLVFTYIGYTSKEVVVGNQTSIAVSLISDQRSLNEVLVTGYGTVQRKREVTGAIATVKGSEFENLPIQSFDKALQGRAAGVQVTSTGGQPGGGIQVRVRGNATINGSAQPLFIVDGIQVASGGASGSTSANTLAGINPDDIESIEVLKDAASAAIYGALAANGVVVVTTKRGKSGKTQVRASAQYGTSSAYNPYDVLNANDWFTLRSEALGNQYQRTGKSYAEGVQAARNQYARFFQGNTIQSYDWIDAIFKRGSVQQYDASASGGDAKTKFFISGSYNNTDGTVINSNYKRGTVRANLSHNITDKLSIESSISLAGIKTVGPSTSAGFFTNGTFTGALFTAPVNPIYNADGTYNTSLVGTTANIVQNQTLEQRRSGIFQTISNMALNYDIIPGLRARAFAGIDFSDVNDFNYRPASLPIALAVGGQGSEQFRRNVNWNMNYSLNYSKRFNEVHNFSAYALYEYRSSTNTVLSGAGQGFASELFNLIGNAGTPTTASSTYQAFKIASLAGNVKYDYKDKYLITANYRYDGSSRFGANNRFGSFYGVSGGWRVTQEDFMKSLTFVSDLKLRASYGVVGALPTDNFGSLALYGNGGQYATLPGLRPTQLVSPNLTWEESKQVDLGIDFGLFNNRITASVDVYNKKNTGLILGRTLPSDSGFGSINENAGAVRNRGLEIQLNTVNVKSGDFQWSTNFNIAFNENELLQLREGTPEISVTGDAQTYIDVVGRPLNSIRTAQYAGVNPADGRPMFYDKNGNITYVPTTADLKFVGDLNPKFYGGFGNTFTYKGLTLDVLFQYQYGNEAVLQTGQVLEASGAAEDNQVSSQLQRWTTPGQITSVPRPYEQWVEPDGDDPTNFSSRYVQTASYIRLKNATLSYQLPQKLTQRLKIPRLSFFVNAVNLVTWTNFRGDDPENVGNSLNQFPNPRTITGGVTLNL
jgi:TonB-linked SusC/RagA family outer membrane protein